jgi:arginine:ornithine antiporter / lysine permease
VSNATYLALISLATSMILVPYLFSAVYACVIAWRGNGYDTKDGIVRRRDTLIAAAATLYCCWLLYAAGLKYLLLSALLYAPGVLLYGWAKREQHARMFRPFELVILAALLALAACAAVLLATGHLGL